MVELEEKEIFGKPAEQEDSGEQIKTMMELEEDDNLLPWTGSGIISGRTRKGGEAKVLGGTRESIMLGESSRGGESIILEVSKPDRTGIG